MLKYNVVKVEGKKKTVVLARASYKEAREFAARQVFKTHYVIIDLASWNKLKKYG